MSKVLEVGVPPPSFSEHQSILVHFHDFESLSTKKGCFKATQDFNRFNHVWSVFLYPGGKLDSSDDMVTVGICLQSKGNITINFGYVIRAASGEIIEETSDEETFGAETETWTLELLPRATVLEKALKNGTFSIEVRMAPVDSKSKYCKYMIPANRELSDNEIEGSIISSLLFDEESADISFDVSSPSDETKQSVQVYAHRNILKARAPDLFRLCAGYDVSNPMPINDVEPEIFRELMRFIYGQHMDTTDWQVDSKAILEAANKYDVANLKVTAEAWYVTHFEFTGENVAGKLLYADAMDCPLLKEAAVEFIVGNGVDVFSSDSFKTVLEARGITLEILQTMAKKLVSSSDAVRKCSAVNDLRICLEQCDLGVDGTQSMLAQCLDTYYKSCVDSDEETEEEAETQEDDQSIDIAGGGD